MARQSDFSGLLVPVATRVAKRGRISSPPKNLPMGPPAASQQSRISSLRSTGADGHAGETVNLDDAFVRCALPRELGDAGRRSGIRRPSWFHAHGGSRWSFQRTFSRNMKIGGKPIEPWGIVAEGFAYMQKSGDKESLANHRMREFIGFALRVFWRFHVDLGVGAYGSSPCATMRRKPDAVRELLYM